MILAEELNFTRAAARLHITQSALSKQITEIEQQNKLHLFIRENRRHIEVTQVGRIFAEEARVALSHIQRAVQLACAAREGSDSSLSIGLAPTPTRYGYPRFCRSVCLFIPSSAFSSPASFRAIW